MVDGDEGLVLVPRLVAMLERSRQSVPPEMRDLARKVEADAARALAAGTLVEEDTGAEDDEQKERLRLQIANREKQLARQTAKKTKETKGR